jgi:hypothetical protein
MISNRKFPGLRLGFLALDTNKGCNTQYMNNICVIAIKTRFGHLIKRKNAFINFRKKLWVQNKQERTKTALNKW